MSTEQHVFDEVPALLTGDADRETVTRVATHLRGCEDCRVDLVSALVAHASLTSAARYAPELAVPGMFAGSVDPAITASLPDISELLARAEAEGQLRSAPVKHRLAAGSDELASRRPLHTRRSWIAAAAVVVAAAGVGGGLYATQGSNTGTRFAMTAFGTGATHGIGTGAGTVHKDDIRLDAAALPKLDSDHYYRVWLTNPNRSTLFALGTLNTDESGDYAVGTDMLDRFTDVEISVQDMSGSPAYSGISVMRGTYRA